MEGTDWMEGLGEQTDKMTKEEFIAKTKKMLELILSEYTSCWSRRFCEEDESEENICPSCNGFLHIEQGGETVDCPVCKGTGLSFETVFDSESFLEFIEHGVIFGDQPFLNLLHCEIEDETPVVPA